MINEPCYFCKHQSKENKMYSVTSDEVHFLYCAVCLPCYKKIKFNMFYCKVKNKLEKNLDNLIYKIRHIPNHIRNGNEHSIWGWLNIECHKNFWYQLIFSCGYYAIWDWDNKKWIYRGWKGRLSDFSHDSGISKLLCKYKNWKYS